MRLHPALLAAVVACAPVPERTIVSVKGASWSMARGDSTTNGKAPVLKAHLKSGDALVFTSWQIDTIERRVSGSGTRLNLNRQVIAQGPIAISLDSVALFESNLIRQHGSVTALTIITGLSAALTVACATNPKSCFGSCPTFYVSDGNHELLLAEGFSASIAPSLEATDVDALARARPTSRRFEIRMRNEAMETHVVRWVNVFAAPRATPTGRVFRTDDGEFRQSGEQLAPVACGGSEGDCLANVTQADGRERLSTTDSTDLAARETIDLAFPALSADSLGVVLVYRHTLVSTYVLYQMLAYLGESAGAFLARLESGDAGTRDRARSLARALGGIEVQLRDPSGSWVTVGETKETGPLATDVHLVKLPKVQGGPVRVRLRLAKGSWRLDQVQLARLGARVEPLRLAPVEVLRHGVRSDAALEQLADSAQRLVTQAGDEYTIVFQLPADFERRELFLETRGYYMEWMRDEWVRETNVPRALQMLAFPDRALRTLAPDFKKHEADMERAFWSSKYVRQ